MMNKEECCECQHYSKRYCHLMDELVNPEDNCGMWNGNND